MRQTLHGARRVLRRQAFRRFWLGMMISRAGDAFTLVALSWVVLGIAGPAQLGVVLMCFGLPLTISSLGFPLGSAIGGVLAGGIGVTGAILAIAGSCLALGLVPLLAPALRTLGGARTAYRLPKTSET